MPSLRTSEPSILIGLQYRGHLSLGEHRARLGFAAYHWSIVITPATGARSEFHRFDVTDGIVLDDAGTDVNPDRDWIFRRQTSSSLLEITRYLGAVRVGKICAGRMVEGEEEELMRFFETVPLPRRESAGEGEGEEEEGPKENCVTWARSALKALDAAAWCRLAEQPLDLDALMEFALRHGDTRIGDLVTTPDVVDYARGENKRGGAVGALVGYVKRLRGSS
ncbi:putative serine threonine protein kinase protein [Lasiodiplodia theobromae]|uniref:Uncharacterized protein n=1 Tax=Lasiodiplodia theobromae TaxID=45133 RepID=A0A5N5D6A6_9PEZI|nr:Serine threonine protein kinase [Lasiodiplodia theobromae]KAB2572860.1 hypothetical protein DBV05_g8482 [Lasiodiplodia theobromae]KAF4537534.1 Serine threonine protein kinase [Lasiodiplodia theobromae]KAF9639497.1 putative serine threonine protein kinase protein [Lasiodiplodia theobromae]